MGITIPLDILIDGGDSLWLSVALGDLLSSVQGVDEEFRPAPWRARMDVMALRAYADHLEKSYCYGPLAPTD